MLLSKLVYLAVKNTTYYDDETFTFTAFMDGNFDKTPEYALEINNVFLPINEAIARLSDLERIPYKVDEVNKSLLGENNILDISSLPVKEIISVAQPYGAEFRVLAFRSLGADKVLISDYIDSRKPLLIEYKEDIPYFDEDDFAKNLKNYGINDSMCNYIIEYAGSKLSEQTSAELSNMHLTRAEQYFANIRAVKSAFPQQKIEVKYGI